MMYRIAGKGQLAPAYFKNNQNKPKRYDEKHKRRQGNSPATSKL